MRGRDFNRGTVAVSRVEEAMGWLMRPSVTGSEDPPAGAFRDDPTPAELAALERAELEQAA